MLELDDRFVLLNEEQESVAICILFQFFIFKINVSETSEHAVSGSFYDGQSLSFIGTFTQEIFTSEAISTRLIDQTFDLLIF